MTVKLTPSVTFSALAAYEGRDPAALLHKRRVLLLVAAGAGGGGCSICLDPVGVATVFLGIVADVLKSTGATLLLWKNVFQADRIQVILGKTDEVNLE